MYNWTESRLGVNSMQHSSRTLVTIGLLGGTFLAAIEATIVATAMPTVVQQLGGLSHYSWVFSAYLLTTTGTMPIWGKLSDRSGRRPFYLAAIGLFVLGSALCGATQSMTQLIIYRAVQGLGAGGIMTLGMTILGDLYTPVERARIQGWFSSVWGVASIIGPFVGGAITDAWSWRWVFYLNLPFGMLAAWLVGRRLEEPPTVPTASIDVLGATLLGAAITTLLVALTQTGVANGALGTRALAVLYAASLLLAVLFVLVERRAADPIVPLDLVLDRFIGMATLTSLFLGVAIFGAISFVPLFVQSALGGTAASAGRSLTALLLGWVTMAVATGRLLPLVGYRPMVIGGLSFISIGFIGLTRVTHESSALWLHGSLTLIGIGTGMAALTLFLATQNAVSRERLGVATALTPFARSVGGAVGVAVMGSLLAASVPAGRAATALEMEHGLHRAFIAGAVVAFAALAVSLFIPGGVTVTRPREGAVADIAATG